MYPRIYVLRGLFCLSMNLRQYITRESNNGPPLFQEDLLVRSTRSRQPSEVSALFFKLCDRATIAVALSQSLKTKCTYM